MCGRIYRHALQEVGRLPGFPHGSQKVNRGIFLASKRPQASEGAGELSDSGLLAGPTTFLIILPPNFHILPGRSLSSPDYMNASPNCGCQPHACWRRQLHHVQYPRQLNDARIGKGRGNCSQQWLNVRKWVEKFRASMALALPKIAFLARTRWMPCEISKERVDPRDVMNPAKLVYRELPVRPFTFSFNRLISDIRESGLPDKESLIQLLSSIQVCTRCGKCKNLSAL